MERNASVDVVRDVHEDVVEPQSVDDRRHPQNRGAFHLALELRPLLARPPANIGGDVVYVHGPTDHLHEDQERHHQHLDWHPERSDHACGEGAVGGSTAEGQHQDRAEHDLVANDRVVAFARSVETPHLLPPHGSQEVRAGTEARPLEPMTQASETTHCRILLDGCRVPHEVEPLAGGVPVMDSVVAKVPRGLDVEAGHHAHLSHDAIGLARIQQRHVRCIVAKHEQARHCKTGQHPQNQQRPPGVGEGQADHRKGIEHPRLSEGQRRARGRTLVARLGDDVAYVVERVSPRGKNHGVRGRHNSYSSLPTDR